MVGDKDDVDDGVGALGGFDGGLEGFLGALVAAVGQNDEDFATGLLGELVVGGEVDGVEEKGAARVAVAGDRAGAGTGVDGGLVEGVLDLAGAVGVVGEQVDVNVEGDEERLVFGGEDVAQESGAGLLLEREDVLLGAGGIEQKADGEREILFLGEVFDGLRALVLEEGAVFLDEVGDEAVLVARGEEEVDEVDIDLDGGRVDVGQGLPGGVGGGGRASGRGGFLGGERRGAEKQREQRESE